VTTPEEARALVQARARLQAGLIKVWFHLPAGDDLAAQEAIVKAAGDARMRLAVRLAVHATELIVAKAARAPAPITSSIRSRTSRSQEFSGLANRNARSTARRFFV